MTRAPLRVALLIVAAWLPACEWLFPVDRLTANGACDEACDGGLDAILAPRGDDASPPLGTLLRRGAGLRLWAVTPDERALYTDADGVLWAQPFDGSPRQAVTTLRPGAVVEAASNVAMVWQDLDANRVGSLGAWTAATGFHALSTASLAGTFAVSADGARVAYLDAASPIASGVVAADVMGAAVDGAARARLASSVLAGASSACPPVIVFAASGPASPLLVASCPSADGAIRAHVQAFAGGSGSPIELLAYASVPPYLSLSAVTDVASALVFTSTSDRVGVVVPVATGAPITRVDTGVAYGLLTGDGASAIYVTDGGALRRSSTAHPAPAALVDHGVAGVYPALPPGERSVVYVSRFDATSTHYDLLLSPAAQSAPVTPLSVTPDVGFAGEPFTQDGRTLFHVFAGDPYGSLMAGALGEPPVLVARGVSTQWGLAGSSIAFESNLEAMAGRLALGDVSVVDLAGSAPPRIVVRHANTGFRVTATRDRIVFTYDAAPEAAGLYVVAVP